MSEEKPVGMDAELQALLADLQKPDATVESKEVEAEPQEVLSESEYISEGTIATPPNPELSDPVIDLEQTEPPSIPIVSTPTDVSELKAIVERFDFDYSEVQANLKRDRSRIDAVIDILLKRVKAHSDAETDTMSLVKALDVLANTNGHAVKLLDSRSKLLSATKSVINANQTNIAITGTDPELQKILGQSAAEDE